MKKMMLVLIASACCSALANRASAQDADKAIADAVIAMVKAQWTADIKDPTNTAAQSKDTSDDYTEFNADYATRIDGKAMSMRLAEAGAKGSEKTDCGGNGQSQSSGIQWGCCHPDLQLYRPDHGQGRKDGTGPGKIHARLCEKGQQLGVGPRKLCVGSGAKIKR